MLVSLLLTMALAQEAPAEPIFEVGPIAFTAVKEAPTPQFAFDTCAAMAPTPPLAARSSPPDGQLVFQLTFRKGRVELVTVAHTEPHLDWLTPCLKRELAHVEWEIRKGKAEVPVHVVLPWTDPGAIPPTPTVHVDDEDEPDPSEHGPAPDPERRE